ncbi:MAG: zinc ribbon domain-containing protein [Candidatus Zixiibacteriota bacterium]
MPIYEYLCKICGNRFEILHRNSNNTIIVCPGCKGQNAERILSTFGFSAGNKFTNSGSKTSCSACSSKNCDTCR